MLSSELGLTLLFLLLLPSALGSGVTGTGHPSPSLSVLDSPNLLSIAGKKPVRALAGVKRAAARDRPGRNPFSGS